MSRVILSCGHAVPSPNGSEVVLCAVCYPKEVTLADPPPDLNGRVAFCACGRFVPSAPDLPFFEYRGPGSSSASACEGCGYAEVAHTQQPASGLMNVVAAGRCSGYVPRTAGLQTDTWYCGHGGWD